MLCWPLPWFSIKLCDFFLFDSFTFLIVENCRNNFMDSFRSPYAERQYRNRKRERERFNYIMGKRKLNATYHFFSPWETLGIFVRNMCVFICRVKKCAQQSYNFFPTCCIFRISLLKDGGLRIANVSKSDVGSYTCLAENQFGKASSSTSLLVTGNWLIAFE